MSCEFCKDGNCCQKEATSSGADAFGIEDPSQLVDPASTASVAKEKEPIDASKTSACFDDAKGACCRMSDHSNRKRLDNIFTRDLIIGLSDGLTVPFALTAGLSSLGSPHFVVVAGLAELFSGAISMGVGGYLSTKAERDNYRYLLRQTRQRVETSCSTALQQEVFNILAPYGISSIDCQRLVQSLENAEKAGSDSGDHDKGLTQFLLKFGTGVETISSWRLYASALTIGISYFIGGLIPMIPYFIVLSTTKALFISIGITAFVLLVFGAIKGHLTGSRSGWGWIIVSALQTLAVGTLAAGAAYGIVRALDNDGAQ